ncbi:MAG: TonB-dependent receptor [Candidatus Levyibacteriota bacterium]
MIAAFGATLVASLAGAPCAWADNAAEVFELPSMQVVAASPLPGLGVPLADVPANVQIFGAGDLARMRNQSLTRFLGDNAASVAIGSGQGNRFQQSLDFRGLTASPLLGTPQGLSVFQDGVRINEAFGDVVNWDLLTRSAISSIQLLPGSIPAYGLNTLGGALAIYTKSGAQYPGASVDVSGGTFGARGAEAEVGGEHGSVDGFATGHVEDDDGWADHNPTHLRQFFGKLGYQNDSSDLDLSLTLADNRLQGTQTLPQSFLDDPRQAYTYPDENDNRLAFVAAKGSHFLSDDLLAGGTAYFRHYRSANLSSNVNDAFGNADAPDAAPYAALNDRSDIDQQSWGGGIQLTWTAGIAQHPNQLAVGLSGDFGLTRFRQDEQYADFTGDRGTIGVGDYRRLTDVALRNAYTGLFATDTLTLAPQWTLTLAGRYNRAHVEIADRSGDDASLDGSHRYSRFNPAIGLNYKPAPGLTAYAGYNEGMRAPTPIELTCADPSAPCKLPNDFLADPPLAMVVSHTTEVGARGKLGAAVDWNAALYRTDLDNDIQFISAGAGSSNAGYFQNVGRTRRDGFEAGVSARLEALRVSLNYSHLTATFRSGFSAASADNSGADANGAIAVRPGDRIPGIPADTLKLRLDYARGAWSVGTGVLATAGQYAHGDENNADVHGRLPGYVLVGLDAQYDASPQLQIYAQVDNVFDRRYYNFGVLGSNVFTGPNRSFGPASGIAPVSEQFVAVGAPRTVSIGLRYRFDAPAPRG